MNGAVSVQVPALILNFQIYFITHFVHRGYSEKKLQGNVECEIMHTLVEEARESYKEEIVKVLPSNGIEDLESNVEKILAWVNDFSRTHSQ